MIGHIPWIKNRILKKEDQLCREDDLFKWSKVESFDASHDIDLLVNRSSERARNCEKTFAAGEASVAWEKGRILFKSAHQGAQAENNSVHGEYFAARVPGAAVLILGHWNSQKESYNRLARAYQAAGVSALRLSLPYHDERRPAGEPIASGFLSADIVRTEASIVQAVSDARTGVSWLGEQGHTRIGVVGASLGSMIGLLTACHDTRVKALTGYLMAADFPDVVWRGSATQHIRAGLEPHISLDELRGVWSSVNPVNYLQRLQRDDFFVHTAWACFDTVCPVDMTARMFSEFKRLKIPNSETSYSCGHNTLAMAPFIHMAGLRGIYEMKKRLRKGA